VLAYNAARGMRISQLGGPGSRPSQAAAETSELKPGRNSHPELDSKVSHRAQSQEITRPEVQERFSEMRT
jgi:hypothetical protein